MQPCTRWCVSLTAVIFTSCAGGSSHSLVPAASPMMVHSQSTCSFGKIKIFNGPASGQGGLGITHDENGNLWYPSTNLNAIVKMTRAGQTTAYTIPDAAAIPQAISEDRHHHMWFTEYNLPRIGEVTLNGVVTTYAIKPLGSGLSESYGIAQGSDGRIWFTTGLDGIGARKASGKTKLYRLKNNNEHPSTIVVGSDKNLWFTEYNGPHIGKITANGHVTEYLNGQGLSSYGITAGPDGRIWFTDPGNHRIGAIKTSGKGLKYYSVGSNTPYEIASRSKDGKLYFTDAYGYIGQVTTQGKVRVCAIPANPAFSAFGITENTDHNMWFVENSTSLTYSRVGELVIP